MVSDKSRSRSVQGLNADRSQPWIVRGHGKTAVVVADWTRLWPVGRTLRDVFQLLCEYSVGNCADDSPDAACSAARPVNWTPTRMLRVRQANCHADFNDNCPDASWLLRQSLRGHLPALREMFPGNCSDTARLLPGRFTGRCADVAPDTARDAARTLRDFLPYIHVRGWCHQKNQGFQVSESRQRFRSAERLKIHAPMCKSQSTERAF